MNETSDERGIGNAPRPDGASRWVGGAAVAAALASVCCLGPLVLAAVGLSAAGFAAFFEPLRPLFLLATAVLLGTAFYTAYFRKAACEVRDRARVRRTRAVLWLAALGVALLAFFPAYGGSLLRLGAAPAAVAGSGSGNVLRLQIDGMTCETCAAGIERSIARVPGVVSATVRYAEGDAIVTTDPDAPPSGEHLIEAVEEAGYRAQLARRSE